MAESIDKATIANPRSHYGSGKSATRNYKVQRLTGMANLLFLLFLVWFVIRLAGSSQAEMVDTIRNPMVALPLALLVINVPLHMRIGMREIIEDYVHNERLNHLSLMLNTGFAIFVAVVGLGSIFKIVFWS